MKKRRRITSFIKKSANLKSNSKNLCTSIKFKSLEILLETLNSKRSRLARREFHNIVFFGRVAEVIAQYCHKGSQLYVEGRLQTRTWEGNDGKKNYRTEVVGETMQFGNKPQGDGSRTTKRSEESQEPEPEDLGTIEYPDEDVNIDDIPF